MIGERIKTAREAAGLTQTEFGRAVGKSVSTVSEWESGKRSPGVKLLPDIAKALSVSVAYLIGETESPSPDAELTETEAHIYAYSFRPIVFKSLLGCSLLVEDTDEDGNTIILGDGVRVVETPEIVDGVMQQTISFFMFILHQMSHT